MISMVVDSELSIMRSIGDYNYKWNIRKVYPSCFVGKAKFRYIGGEDNAPVSSKGRANKARRAAVDYKVMIMVNIINTRSASKIRKMIDSDIRLWVEICDFSYDDTDPSTSDPIYDTFLFKSYMSVAGDNPDLNKFIVSLRGRMLKYDLRSLYLYLAIFMAINGGILLSEDDLLAALIL